MCSKSIKVGSEVKLPPVYGTDHRTVKGWRTGKVLEFFGQPKQALVSVEGYKESFFVNDLLHYMAKA